MPSRKMPTLKPVRRLKEPALNVPFQSRSGDMELKILVQPEEQHRARYLTEGSRGAIKDKSQNGFPTVKVHATCVTKHRC